MRMIAILAASSLLLLGCDTKSHKITPRPLAKKATFELFVVSATNGANTKTDKDPGGAEIYLTTPAVITSTDVATVHLAEDSQVDQSLPGSISLTVTLTPTGASKLAAATATPNGMRFAIVVNDSVVAVPVVRTKLSNSFLISSNKTESLFDLLTND